MSEPIIEFERVAILRKVMKIPDRRYKTGYREKRVLAESSYQFPPHVDGTNLAQSHIHKFDSYIHTDAFAEVSFKLLTRTRAA